MTLGEERNEQNKQAWRAHLEQERLDLSASVEAALMNDSRLAQDWQDEVEEENPQPVTGGTGIVPPRLSLQSVMQPAVQPERVVTATTDQHQTASSHLEEGEGVEQKPSGMLARLVRGFTSTFTGINPVVKVERPQQQRGITVSGGSFTQDMEPHRSLHDGGHFSTAVNYSDDVPLVRVIDTIPSVVPIPEAPPFQSPLKRRRSLKRNGKVRLETAEQPALSKSALSPGVEDQETGETLQATDVKDAPSRQQVSPAVAEQREEKFPTPEASSAVVHASLSGSGVFESEQGEVLVVNAHITATSVVLVTLTTDPGPVVVQYISLQPQMGFTVHLTAPVATRTTFNYVVIQTGMF